MKIPDPPRILIVDDEEAILETMSFTFMDVYEVFTSSDARRGLEILDEQAPIACVITDQRMPGMTGVEFLAEAYERHPDTVRIMLTGFADAGATIQAINAGHVYAYVDKPWDPDELKQIVERAVAHNLLASENKRLLAELRSTNSFLEAVMDRLKTGALAVDSDGIVRAANQPAREYLALQDDPRGTKIDSILENLGIAQLGGTVMRLVDEGEGAFEEVDLAVPGRALRLRVSAQRLPQDVGSVIMFKEVSHEPLRRRFEEIVSSLGSADGDLRPRLEQAIEEMAVLSRCVGELGVKSPSMEELRERVSRTQTAVQNWLDIDDTLAREEYPDAQLLLDRLRVASQRWPHGDELPSRVVEMSKVVESYYESGEHPGRRIL